MEIVSPAIESYCEAHSAVPDALLTEVHDYTTRNLADAQMLIGPLEAALLQLLVRVSRARRILEIGAFTGYSALAMAEAMPNEGTLVTCEIDPKHADIANGFFRRSAHGRKISLRLGPALDTLDALTGAVFDFVFIDADKENYVNYYNKAIAMLKPGGLVVADNVLWSGSVLNPTTETDRAVVAFNEHVRSDRRAECIVLPLRDGVSVIRKI
jgi:predicted O-methyltransferase YrrM